MQMEDIPICIIRLSEDLSILDYNSYLREELKTYNITDYTFVDKITSYLKTFSKSMKRQKAVLSIKNVMISCVASHVDDKLYIEPTNCKKPFINFINNDLKSLVSVNLDMTNFLVKTLLTPEHKKYIEPLRDNNMLIIKTINNAADYCKISSGLVQLNIEDFYFTRAITEIEKINTPTYTKVRFLKSRDVILSTDYKKFVEMIVHVLSYSFSNKLEVAVLTSVKDNIFVMYFKDNGPRISKYQRETMFEGFIHGDTTNKSLSMPIARGIALLLGGNLEVNSCIEYGTTFKFTMVTRDVESD